MAKYFMRQSVAIYIREDLRIYSRIENTKKNIYAMRRFADATHRKL